jgi:hypothetical protein
LPSSGFLGAEVGLLGETVIFGLLGGRSRTVVVVVQQQRGEGQRSETSARLWGHWRWDQRPHPATKSATGRAIGLLAAVASGGDGGG